MDDFGELDRDGWEFDTVKCKDDNKTVKVKVEPSTVKATQTYTRNPETLPLVRMFMTAEQKAAEAQNQNGGNFMVMPKYVSEGSSSSISVKLEPPPSLPSSATNTIHGQLDEPKTIKESSTIPSLSLNEQKTMQQESLLNHTSARLVPGASPRNLMNSPVSKLIPLSRSGSSDGSKPMIRARSHSEQRIPYEQNDNSVVKMPVNVSSPLARRVRSATTLRPPEEDGTPLKQILNKQQQQQQQVKPLNPLQIDFEEKKVKDSHRRSISDISSNKKVCIHTTEIVNSSNL